MKIVLTKHAKRRMAEREISRELMEEALRKPTEILYDYEDKKLIKKLYRKNGIRRLLLVIIKTEEGIIKVITVIDTSKVGKYL